MNLFATLMGIVFGSALVRFAKPLLLAVVGLILLTAVAHLLHLDDAMRDAHARNLAGQQHAETR